MSDSSMELAKAVTEGAAKGAVEGLLEPVRDFVSAVAGVPSKELSGWLGVFIRYQRWKTEVRILMKAQAFLVERGIEPQQVSLKVLVPLLEQASLEDESDDSMQSMWAALLANAAAGPRGHDVLPSFPTILADLSPDEAAILSELYYVFSDFSEEIEAILEVGPTLDRVKAASKLGASDFDVRLENLIRLGLCKLVDSPLGTIAEKFGEPELSKSELEKTVLGTAFMAACAPPDKQEQDHNRRSKH